MSKEEICLRIELKFDCPHKQCFGGPCGKKMRTTIFKRKNDEEYSWIALQSFCDEQPTRGDVINALRKYFWWASPETIRYFTEKLRSDSEEKKE